MDEYEIYRYLVMRCSKEDIHEICFYLKVDHEDLDGRTKKTLALSLIQHAKRHSTMNTLSTCLKEGHHIVNQDEKISSEIYIAPTYLASLACFRNEAFGLLFLGSAVGVLAAWVVRIEASWFGGQDIWPQVAQIVCSLALFLLSVIFICLSRQPGTAWLRIRKEIHRKSHLSHRA